MRAKALLIPLALIAVFFVGRTTVARRAPANVTRPVPNLEVESAHRMVPTDDTVPLWETNPAQACSVKPDGFTVPDELPLECIAYLSLVDFVDAARAREFRHSVRARLRPVTYTAAIIADAVPDELYEKLAESRMHLDAVRERLATADTLENRVLHTCWTLLHGEMLALKPLNRCAMSFRMLSRGQRDQGAVVTELEDVMLREALQTEHPAACLLWHSVKTRTAVIADTQKRNEVTLLAENIRKTDLLGQYRELLDRVLAADTAFYVGDWTMAENAFSRANDLARRLDGAIADYRLLDDEGENLPNRSAYLFVPEPGDTERNSNEPVEYLPHRRFASALPTARAMARLGHLQRQSDLAANEAALKAREAIAALDQSGAVSPDNPIGFLARGLLREYENARNVEHYLAVPADAPADLPQQVDTARVAAFDDLKKACEGLRAHGANVRLEVLPRPTESKTAASRSAMGVYQLVSHVSPVDRNASMSTIVRAPEPGPREAEGVVGDAAARLESTLPFRRDILRQMAGGRPDEARATARQMLLTHGTEERSWVEYIAAGLRSGGDPDELLEHLALVGPLATFDSAPWRREQAQAAIHLARAQRILLEDRSFVEELMLRRHETPPASEVDRICEADAALRMAEKHSRAAANLLEQSRHVGADVDKTLIDALHLSAGANRLLLAMVEDAQSDLAPLRREAEELLGELRQELDVISKSETELLVEMVRATEQSDLRAAVETLETRTRLLESLASTLAAQGILLMIDKDSDQWDKALSALAASDEIASRIVRQSAPLSSLLAAALLRRVQKQEDPNSERRMRLVYQGLTEGVLLGRLGNATTGLRPNTV